MTELKRTTHFKLPTGILDAALAADGKSLVAGCMDGVFIADLEGKTFAKIDQHASYVSSVAWLSEGIVLSAGYDGALHWTDVAAEKRVREVALHDFWSWDMAVSPDRKLIASVTGQYLAGGYKYEPQPEREPSVRIVSAETGQILHSLPHVPSVQSVAFSNDGRYVAAGNLMGEVRVWDVQTGAMQSTFTTPDLTSWGIIKSHCYLGGIFAMSFKPDDSTLLIAGMGQMRDPMAGNGRQLWQEWSWQEPEPRKLDETHKDESGEGLMETLAVHPDGKRFVMGGRLRGGDWNVALFDLHNGNRLATLKTGYRVTHALFSDDGARLILVGSQGQPNDHKDGVFPDFGRVEVYEVS